MERRAEKKHGGCGKRQAVLFLRSGRASEIFGERGFPSGEFVL